jgi:GT2 family glycosyltransferase/glycosyltransferase involved in cell wall biosynthesis
MPEAGTSRLPDFVVIAQESWNQVERRNQLLVRALAERNPRTRFLFAEQPFRPRELHHWRRPRLRRLAPNIWAVRLIRPVPDRASQVLSDKAEAAQLRRAMRKAHLTQHLLWTQDPRAASLVDLLPIAGVVYDLTDDWAAFESDPVRRAIVQRRIEALGTRADLVLACSRTLEKGARAWSSRLEYLPNAVEGPGPALAAPADVAVLPRPLLGYAGTLHSARLDVDLLVGSARQRPDWSFAFLGPDLLEQADRERLWALPNAHNLGVRPHAAVRSYIETFDVCLLPNLDNEFTRSLDPLKLYEYLAAGRPVVATPVGETSDLKDHILLAKTVDELVAAAERAMAEDGPEAVAGRKAAVSGATWGARAAAIESALGRSAPQPAEHEVSVVIVSFNTRELLERCLEGVRAQEGVDLQVIVVDNASADGSSEMVRERFPEVELIQMGENAGFAKANNVAFDRCRGTYVLLLNSDAFLARGAISELVAAAERHYAAGAVGPRLLNTDGTLQRSAWPFPSPGRLALEAVGLHRPLRRIGLLEDLGTWAHDEERTVDFLIGACLLLRAEALAEAGGFDETFWLYGEEADLQRRLADRGWAVVLTPGAEATHVGSASSSESTTRLKHFYSGQRRFLRKHGGPAAWPVAWLSLLVGALLRRRWAVIRVAARLR